MNQMESIRSRSIKIVADLGLPVNPNLPLLETPQALRTTEEVINRIFAMSCVTACVFGFDRSKGWLWLQQENCLDYLTTSEKFFFQTGIVNRNRINTQIESIWVLAWCVNKVKELNVSEPCSENLVYLMPDLKKMESGESFRNTVTLRKKNEIIENCDLAYCLHWSVVDFELRGKKKWKLPISPAEIVERRHAFEWMISMEHWDDISLDT
ncbi:unannotated protein [freshwater metagenome]|uniref:Unannotated protein n=1 Tax=freshwater metagenome TaxID=449393 RepID=A0A6J6ZWU7_9ZZZZ